MLPQDGDPSAPSAASSGARANHGHRGGRQHDTEGTGDAGDGPSHQNPEKLPLKSRLHRQGQQSHTDWAQGRGGLRSHSTRRRGIAQALVYRHAPASRARDPSSGARASISTTTREALGPTTASEEVLPPAAPQEETVRRALCV